jgi:hypothetical protein
MHFERTAPYSAAHAALLAGGGRAAPACRLLPRQLLVQRVGVGRGDPPRELLALIGGKSRDVPDHPAGDLEYAFVFGSAVLLKRSLGSRSWHGFSS